MKKFLIPFMIGALVALLVDFFNGDAAHNAPATQQTTTPAK